MDNWQSQMDDLIRKYEVISTLTTADLSFSSGHVVEVFLALSDRQRISGLSVVDSVDMGMLFCYDAPTYVPFTMKDTKVDLDIAHYDISGKLIQKGTYKAHSEEYVTCPVAFSFVLEMPVGQLPEGDFRIN